MTHRTLRRAAATFFVMVAGALFVAPNAPAQNQKWVQLFNGKNLDGWVPKFSGFDLGVNYNETFRVENGVMVHNLFRRSRHAISRRVSRILSVLGDNAGETAARLG